MTPVALSFRHLAAVRRGEQPSEQNSEKASPKTHDRKFENGVNRVNQIYGNILGIVKYMITNSNSKACVQRGVLFTTFVHSLSYPLRVMWKAVHSVHSRPLARIIGGQK